MNKEQQRAMLEEKLERINHGAKLIRKARGQEPSKRRQDRTALKRDAYARVAYHVKHDNLPHVSGLMCDVTACRSTAVSYAYLQYDPLELRPLCQEHMGVHTARRVLELSEEG